MRFILMVLRNSPCNDLNIDYNKSCCTAAAAVLHYMDLIQIMPLSTGLGQLVLL